LSEAGRILALDFGSVRLGLAVSDREGRIASPLTTYRRQDSARDSAYLRQVIADEQVTRIVVGLPVHLDGREGAKAREARAFGAWLRKATYLDVVFWDERFTTVEAESHLWAAGLPHRKRKDRRDRVAAQILLQAYLDAGCPKDPITGPLDG
jgi:putative Holliday junction resolvase